MSQVVLPYLWEYGSADFSWREGPTLRVQNVSACCEGEGTCFVYHRLCFSLYLTEIDQQVQEEGGPCAA